MNEPSEKKSEFRSELAQHPRVYGTHHIGASTEQSEAAIGEEAARMVVEFNKSGLLPNCVNLGLFKNNQIIYIRYNNNPNALANILLALNSSNVNVFDIKIDAFNNGSNCIGYFKV